MSRPDELAVWYEHRRVDALWRNPVGLIGFRYHAEWIKAGFAISRSLPLENREFPPEAATAHRFVCTRAIERIDERLAFHVGGNAIPPW